MNSSKNTARIVGALFLIAMTSSLVGAVLLETVIGAPDYLAGISENTSRVYTGVYLEIINVIAVLGIAAMLFGVLKQHNENLAAAYLGFRIVEVVFLILAAICPLLLLSLGKEYMDGGTADVSIIQNSGSLIYAARGYVASLLIPVFFGLGALLLYASLYVTKLLPRFISVWGLIGVAMMIAFNLLRLNSELGMFFVLPIIMNEIFLGIWLIIKGFNTNMNS